MQLQNMGAASISDSDSDSDSGRCTFSEQDLFYPHRRTGRAPVVLLR